MHTDDTRGQRGNANNFHPVAAPGTEPQLCKMDGIDVFYCEHHNSATCGHSCNYKGKGILGRAGARLKHFFSRSS